MLFYLIGGNTEQTHSYPVSVYAVQGVCNFLCKRILRAYAVFLYIFHFRLLKIHLKYFLKFFVQFEIYFSPFLHQIPLFLGQPFRELGSSWESLIHKPEDCRNITVMISTFIWSGKKKKKLSYLFIFNYKWLNKENRLTVLTELKKAYLCQLKIN